MFILKLTENQRYVASITSNGTMPLTDHLDNAFQFASIPEIIRAMRQAPAVRSDIQNHLEIRRVDVLEVLTDGGLVS